MIVKWRCIVLILGVKKILLLELCSFKVFVKESIKFFCCGFDIRFVNSFMFL